MWEIDFLWNYSLRVFNGKMDVVVCFMISYQVDEYQKELFW